MKLLKFFELLTRDFIFNTQLYGYEIYQVEKKSNLIFI